MAEQTQAVEVKTHEMTPLQAHLLMRDTPTYASYYNGKMSYALHGKEWGEYVKTTFPELDNMYTPENVYKTVIDLYAENLVPVPEELKGFANVLVPLLSRGEAIVLVDRTNTPHYPEHFEIISDGRFTIAAIFTRDLAGMKDNLMFADSDGNVSLWSKPIPKDFAAATKEGYQFVEAEAGYTLFRFALDDKGFGGGLAAHQDRINHSVLDQTVVAEMYARPFWYLLNVEEAPYNPYMPAHQTPDKDNMKERDVDGAAGRIFTSSGEGPFGQLDPPTLTDMIAYHDSIVDKTPQSFGIPAHYLKPGTGTPPTGVALKVLSKRYNNKISRMRDDLDETLRDLADLLGVEKTAEKAKSDNRSEAEDTEAEVEMDYEFWPQGDDLLQEALDQHGINLAQMGYPLEYIVEVVTPGVNLEDYQDDGWNEDQANNDGPPQPPTGPTGNVPGQLPATPAQVAAYQQNPGQRATPNA